MSIIVKDCRDKLVIGQAFVDGCDLLCPVSTSTAVAISEQPELRAYKLGKQKCSYNQVELLFNDLSGDRPTEMKISEAIEICVGAEIEESLRESCLKFNVRFLNNRTMHLYIYVVYADAHLKLNSPGSDNRSIEYYWMPLTRSKCIKGCTGPVIRGLQRFGKMSRRVVGTQEGGDQDSWKEPKHLYIAIDEASTHVCTSSPTAPKFRLLLAAYNQKYELLGTTISSSIRVLANNDAPLGAASFKVHFNLQGGWSETIGQNPRLIGRSDGMLLQGIKENKSPTNESRTDELARLGAIVVADVSKAKEIQSMYPKSPSTQNLNPKVCQPDNHSLNELCERIFKFCASKVDSIIPLRTLATLLGTRKRRIYEIFNVLQCVLVVQQQEGEEKYFWLGTTRISYAIKKLKEEALSCKSNRARKFRLLSEEMVENPMRELTERFIQLFLVDEERSITLEVAIEEILDKHNDPQTYRCKIRRLTEIARIFTALNLINIDNPGPERAFSTGSLYSWRGARGVRERLEMAGESNTKKIYKRTRIPLKCKQKTVKYKRPTVENAVNTVALSMPGLVSEPDNDDAPSPVLLEYNRPIKRPRLCSTTTATARKLLTESTAQSLNASKFTRSPPSLKGSVDYSSAVKNSNQEFNSNNPDIVDYEAAFMLMSLSASSPIKEQSSSQVQADHQIEASQLPEPTTLNELQSFQPEICEFNPLYNLHQLFSAAQIEELQVRNEGFLHDFVRYSRQLYHWQRPGQGKGINLFNPVPLRARTADNNNSARE